MNILSKIRELANLPIQIKFLQSKINNIEYSISNIEKKINEIDIQSTETKSIKYLKDINKNILNMNLLYEKNNTACRKKTELQYDILKKHIKVIHDTLIDFSLYHYDKHRNISEMKQNILNMLELPEESNYPIVFITDQNYIEQTTIAISSLIRHRKKNTRYSIYILCKNLHDNDYKKLDLFSGAAKIIPVEYHLKNIFNQKNHVTTSALIKFELPNIFRDFENILYLDSDLIVLQDISYIFSLFDTKTYAGVVKDAGAMLQGSHKNIHLSNYFNSGVMLLNLKKMRIDDITNKLWYQKESIQETNFMDQDIFNIVFNENVTYLPLKFNSIADHYLNYSYHDITNITQYPDKIVRDSFQSPAILHFAGADKPWEVAPSPRKEFYFNEKLYLDFLAKIK